MHADSLGGRRFAPVMPRLLRVYNVALTLVCLAFASVIFLWLVNRYQTAHKIQKSIFVVSSSYGSFQSLGLIEENSKGMTIFKSYDEPGMRVMLADLGVPAATIKAEKPLLLNPKSGQNASVVQDQAIIQSRLKTAFDYSNNQRIPLLALMALIGIGFGSLVKIPRPYLAFPLMIGAFAMAYKINHACLVCPTVTFVGIPVELMALCLYVLLLISSTFAVNRQLAFLGIGASCLAALGVQMALSWNGQALCYPCICTAFVNGVVAAQVTHPFQTIPEFRKAKRTFGLCLVGALASFGYAAIPTIAPVIPEASNLRPKAGGGPQSLRGLTVQDIALSSQKGTHIVAIFSHECGACAEAKNYLATRPWLPIKQYTLTAPGTPPQNADEIRFQAGRLSSVPRILYIKDDKIVTDSVGWSTDKAWQEDFDRKVAEFLHLSSEKDKQ